MRTTVVLSGAALVTAMLPISGANAADVEYYKGFTTTNVSFAAYPGSVSKVSAFMNIDYTNHVARGYSWLDLTSTAGFTGNVYTLFEKQSGGVYSYYYGNSADGVRGARVVSATDVVACGGGSLFTSYAEFFVRNPSGDVSRGTQPSAGQQTACTR